MDLSRVITQHDFQDLHAVSTVFKYRNYT